jgi:hypothetical protein
VLDRLPFSPYSSNVPAEVLEDDLISIFEPFGKVEKCTVHDHVDGKGIACIDPSISSVGTSTNGGSLLKIATIEYRDPSAAAMAESSMNNFKLGTTSLLLKAVTKDQAAAATTPQNGCRSVHLENMVTLEDTADPDLKDEIGEEARRYGALRDIELVVREPGGEEGGHPAAAGSVLVVLHYENAGDAAKACAALSNRAFANRRIKATLAQ